MNDCPFNAEMGPGALRFSEVDEDIKPRTRDIKCTLLLYSSSWKMILVASRIPSQAPP